MPGTTLMPMPGCAIASAHAAVGVDTESGRAVFERFVELFYRRRQMRAAFESCVVARGFVDHTPEGAGQRNAAMTRLAARFGTRAEAPVACELHHIVFDRDIGMVHLSAREAPGAEPARRVEIYRVAGGRIVEHWSVGA